MGFVAVFAGAAKTPLACTIMGVEMFVTPKGLIVNDVSDAEHARMREKVQPVWKMFIPSVGEGLYKEVRDQIAAK